MSTDYVFITAFDNLPALDTSLYLTISSYFTEFIQNIFLYIVPAGLNCEHYYNI